MCLHFNWTEIYRIIKWGKWRNSELYFHIEKLTNCARKRWIALYGHVARLSPNRLTNRLFTYWQNKMVTTTSWLTEAENDITEMWLADLHNKQSVGQILKRVRGFREEPRKERVPDQRKEGSYTGRRCDNTGQGSGPEGWTSLAPSMTIRKKKKKKQNNWQIL